MIERTYPCECKYCIDFGDSVVRVRECDECGEDGTLDHIEEDGRHICHSCQGLLEEGAREEDES